MILKPTMKLIEGRVVRAYKHLWPSMRSFFLWACREFQDKVYVVSEDKQYTYRETRERAAKTASIFMNVYGVKKGLQSPRSINSLQIDIVRSQVIGLAFVQEITLSTWSSFGLAVCLFYILIDETPF